VKRNTKQPEKDETNETSKSSQSNNGLHPEGTHGIVYKLMAYASRTALDLALSVCFVIFRLFRVSL
jgi:hypothetical protein